MSGGIQLSSEMISDIKAVVMKNDPAFDLTRTAPLVVKQGEYFRLWEDRGDLEENFFSAAHSRQPIMDEGDFQGFQFFVAHHFLNAILPCLRVMSRICGALSPS